jgi:hypothetical protein
VQFGYGVDSYGNVNDVLRVTQPPGTTPISGIALKVIQLSGEVNASVNGDPPDRVDMWVRKEGSNQGLANFNFDPYSAGNKSWTVFSPAFSAPTDILFTVTLLNSGGMVIGQVNDFPVSVSNSSISSIQIDADITTIVLSGTIGTVKLNGGNPIDKGVFARRDDGLWLGNAGISGSNWNLTFLSSNLSPGDIIEIGAWVEFQDGGEWAQLQKVVTTRMYDGSGLTPSGSISLGNVNITTKSINGTIAGLPGGISSASVAAFAVPITPANVQYAQSLVIGYSLVSGGAWTMTILDEPSVYFAVVAYSGGGSPSHIYAATSPSTTSGSISLNTAGMTQLLP